MMRPCVGVEGICPPLCCYKELIDGTYTLENVLLFNITIDDLVTQYKKEISILERSIPRRK